MKMYTLVIIAMATACVVVAAVCDHTYSYSYDPKKDVKIVCDEKIGKRLWVQVKHGPSRAGGWFVAVGYPEFYITNGESTAEMAIRELSKEKCFCGGEWWLKTNGWVTAFRRVTRTRVKCMCERKTWYIYQTNFYHTAESEVPNGK